MRDIALLLSGCGLAGLSILSLFLYLCFKSAVNKMTLADASKVQMAQSLAFERQRIQEIAERELVAMMSDEQLSFVIGELATIVQNLPRIPEPERLS